MDKHSSLLFRSIDEEEMEFCKGSCFLQDHEQMFEQQQDTYQGKQSILLNNSVIESTMGLATMFKAHFKGRLLALHTNV